MALDAYIQPRQEAPRLGGDYEYVCSFDDDGYFWFLYPLFADLAKETGLLIDLYGNASFTGEALDALLRTLAAAHNLVDAQPDQWEVVTGIEMGSMPKEVRCVVEKRQMRDLLNTLETAAREAKTAGMYVTFYGD